jgi:hypothetical protein
MKLLADVIEERFSRFHSIGRADLDDRSILDIWHVPDPDAKVVVCLEPHQVTIALAKRPKGTPDGVEGFWRHCPPIRLHPGDPTFLKKFVYIVKRLARKPVNEASLTLEGDSLVW